MEFDIKAKIEEANRKVTEIFTKARPVWTKIAPAIDVIPGMEKNKILVAGPPIAVKDITIPVRAAVCGAAVHDVLRTLRRRWPGRRRRAGRQRSRAAQGQTRRAPCAPGAGRGPCSRRCSRER